VLATTWGLAEREAEIRRANAERLLAAVQEQPGFTTIETAPAARPGYLRLPVVATFGSRRAVATRAAQRLGVMPGYPKALCDVERVQQRCFNRGDRFSGSRLLAARVCTLPTHSRLSADDLLRLEGWIRALPRT
jgi:dTDP-4-amino-4,6-dideoxygalactose transaminase